MSVLGGLWWAVKNTVKITWLITNYILFGIGYILWRIGLGLDKLAKKGHARNKRVIKEVNADLVDRAKKWFFGEEPDKEISEEDINKWFKDDHLNQPPRR